MGSFIVQTLQRPEHVYCCTASEWKFQRISLSVPFQGEKYIDIKSSFEINNCDTCIKWGCCCLCYTFVTSFLATGNFLSWTKLNPIFSLLINPWFCLQKGWVHMIFFLNNFPFTDSVHESSRLYLFQLVQIVSEDIVYRKLCTDFPFMDYSLFVVKGLAKLNGSMSHTVQGHPR